MKKTLTTLFLLTAASLSTAAFAQSTTTTNANCKSVSLLFVQVADDATLTPIKDKAGTYELNLDGVKNFVGYFSDRPARISGLYPTSKFIARWDADNKPDSFNKVPPNVALHAVSTGPFSTKIVNLPLQLSQPTYDVKTKTLHYTAQVLPGVKVKVPTDKLENVTLFIDSYNASGPGSQF